MAKETLTISSIELHKISIPLTAPFVTSLGPMFHAENVILRICTREGITGWGECSPFMTINGESADTALVVGKYFNKILEGKNALNIGACIADMDRVIYANNSIKSAYDMALYDIAAQHAQLPLYRYLGGMKNVPLYTDYTVSIGAPETMAADALRIKENGFSVIKVKLGRNGAEDVARIKAIREAVGSKIPLRTDANQGWDFEEALQTLVALEPYNIQHCEEPLPRHEFMRLPELRRQSPVRIMADESCCDPNDLRRLIALKACSLINIKLGKSGGIFKALQMIKMAEAAGMKIQIGAFLESRLAMTAFAHLALCSANIAYFDFDTALMFSRDPVEDGLEYGSGGCVRVPETPGLGARLKAEAMATGSHI